MSKKFYLKDWHGKEKEFTDEKIFVRGEDGELIQFTQGTGGGSSADVRYVTFMNHDGTVEYGKKAVAVGDDCADPIARGVFAMPTRESDAQYNYTFYGWATAPNGAANSNWNKAITEDKTVYANFAAAVRYYTITYYDNDGTTVLKTESLAYGAMPSYAPTNNEYDFAGWQPTPSSVTGNASYTATWTPKPDLIAEGNCGDSATWTLASNGVLTISGTGAMYNFVAASGQPNSQPWRDYRETEVTSIVIEPGITYIGNYSFFYHKVTTSASIPSTVTAIGASAFSNAAGLQDVDLSGVESIGNGAFTKTSLTRVTTSAATIEDEAFYNCDSLTSIDITGVQSLGYAAFGYCDALTSVTIPTSVTSMGSASGGAFYGSAITSATFEDTEGWSYSNGEAVDVTDPSANASLVRNKKLIKQ